MQYNNSVLVTGIPGTGKSSVCKEFVRQAGVSKFTVLPIAPLLAEAIDREVTGQSLTALHQPENVFLYR